MSLSSHSVPGSNAGFSYQFERALLWLAQSTAGAIVGIETDDDVAVKGLEEGSVLEQDKHSVREDGEPFGDRSKDLWNTLSTWIQAVDANEVIVGKTLFLMVTNKKLPECLAKQIGTAIESPEVDACIEQMKKASAKPPKEISDLVKRVLSPSSQENLKKLIPRCRLLDATCDTGGEELRRKTLQHLQLPQWCSSEVDSILDELLGWLHKTVLAKWQQREPGWIQRDHFVNQLYAILDRRKRKIVRERAEHLIHVADETIGEKKGSVFVRQLYLITDDNSIVDGSIRDFIRCSIEKSRLSAEGDVTDEDWLAFESTLLSRWSKIRARILRVKEGADEKDIGFEIFSDTTEQHREKLAGSDTEQVYLTSGTYLPPPAALELISTQQLFAFGYPDIESELDDENRRFVSTLTAIEGNYGGVTNHTGLHVFESEYLQGRDPNGLSGGPVTILDPRRVGRHLLAGIIV